MPPDATEDLSSFIETLYRAESGRILATLVRLLGAICARREVNRDYFESPRTPGNDARTRRPSLAHHGRGIWEVSTPVILRLWSGDERLTRFIPKR